MTMKMVVAAVLLLASASGHAADSLRNGYKYAITAYATGVLNDTRQVRYYSLYSQARVHMNLYDFVQPAVAVAVKNKRRNYHMAELTRLNFQKTENNIGWAGAGGLQMKNYRINTADVAVRYEYMIPFIKKQGARLVPSLGAAAMPWMSFTKLSPYTTENYPMRTGAIGIKSFIVPRITVSISPRIYLDVNVPICIMDMGTTWQNIQNPTLPLNAQRYSIADFSVFPAYYSARLGAGIKL